MFISKIKARQTVSSTKFVCYLLLTKRSLLGNPIISHALNSDTEVEVRIVEKPNQGTIPKTGVIVFGCACLVLFCTSNKEQIHFNLWKQ
jgi:hypothetical protein